MIRHMNSDDQGSRYVVASKIGMPSKQLIYPRTPTVNVFRGGDTKNPVFNECQPTPYAGVIGEAPRRDNAWTNRYEWNGVPLTTHAPAIKL